VCYTVGFLRTWTFTNANKMQSETAHFAAVPPPGELDETVVVSDSAHSLSYVTT